METLTIVLYLLGAWAFYLLLEDELGEPFGLWDGLLLGLLFVLPWPLWAALSALEALLRLLLRPLGRWLLGLRLAQWAASFWLERGLRRKPLPDPAEEVALVESFLERLGPQIRSGRLSKVIAAHRERARSALAQKEHE